MTNLIKIEKLNLQLNLKAQLDEIDSIIKNAAWDGYYWSRLNILVGKWEKGRIIGEYRGGKIANITWRELEEKQVETTNPSNTFLGAQIACIFMFLKYYKQLIIENSLCTFHFLYHPLTFR